MGDVGQPRTVRADTQLKFVVADRDGTLIAERHYIRTPGQVELIDGVASGLAQLQQAGVGLVIVTNQSGIARGYFSRHEADLVSSRVLELLSDAGVEVAGVYMCPHLPDDNCQCRKPKTGLLERAAEEQGFTPGDCVVVGDKPCDIEMGRAFGSRTALVLSGYGSRYPLDGVRPDITLDHAGQLAGALDLLDVHPADTEVSES